MRTLEVWGFIMSVACIALAGVVILFYPLTGQKIWWGEPNALVALVEGGALFLALWGVSEKYEGDVPRWGAFAVALTFVFLFLVVALTPSWP